MGGCNGALRRNYCFVCFLLDCTDIFLGRVVKVSYVELQRVINPKRQRMISHDNGPLSCNQLRMIRCKNLNSHEALSVAMNKVHFISTV